VYREQKVVVVMPAYNAEATLERTHREVLEQGVVDLVIVVDDCGTTAPTRSPQKTCYRLALEHGADIVVMVHPDYQYTPLLIPALVSLIGNGLYDFVFDNQMLAQVHWLGCTMWSSARREGR